MTEPAAADLERAREIFTGWLKAIPGQPPQLLEAIAQALAETRNRVLEEAAAWHEETAMKCKAALEAASYRIADWQAAGFMSAQKQHEDSAAHFRAQKEPK